MKTTLIFFVLIIISVLVSSCAAPGKRLVILHNSSTGDTTRCEMNIMSTPNSFEACVDGYKKVGYKIVSDG